MENEIQYYIVDVETTGLSTKLHEITEFSIIRCKDKLNYFSEVRCDHPESASLDALRITGKTQDDLLRGISKKEACEGIINFLEKDGSEAKYRCIVGHNIAFDKKFLLYMFDEENFVLPVTMWLDTMALTRNLMKKTGSKGQKASLEASCKFVGSKMINQFHNSKTDSRNTYYLWESLKQQVDYLPFIKTDIIKTSGAESNNNYDFDPNMDI